MYKILFLSWVVQDIVGWSYIHSVFQDETSKQQTIAVGFPSNLFYVHRISVESGTFHHSIIFDPSWSIQTSSHQIFSHHIPLNNPKNISISLHDFPGFPRISPGFPISFTMSRLSRAALRPCFPPHPRSTPPARCRRSSPAPWPASGAAPAPRRGTPRRWSPRPPRGGGRPPSPPAGAGSHLDGMGWLEILVFSQLKASWINIKSSKAV